MDNIDFKFSEIVSTSLTSDDSINFNFKNGNEMRDAKEQVMSYLLQQFQMMLEDNFDEYCEQFENYLRFRKNEDFHTHKHDHDHNH